MNVTVHIERLVLEGVDLGPGAAGRLRAALAQALSEALAGQPVPWPALRAPTRLTVSLPAGGALGPGPAAALGRDTGRALGAGFTAGGGAA